VITVRVDLAERGYDVLIGDGALDALGQLVAERAPAARRVAVVTQAALAATARRLQAGVPADVHLIGEGERAKTLATVEELCREFAVAGLTRSDAVVALGGGVVTDVAGFAAASYHRGTALVNAPTSLLGQIDAAIGGKTGVNLPEGKNLVGAFWQPAGVLCDTATLATLPGREWASGRGEMAKYAFLGPGEPDASLLDLPIEEQVGRCAAIKAAVVASDEREGDRRMVLNYGHTLAHALEAADFGDDGEGLRHGEAVAVGLIFAALLARRLGRIDDDRVTLHRRVVAGFDLPVTLPEGTSAAAMVSFMARDKKAHHDLTFVLDGPQGVEPVRGVGTEEVLATLAEMGANP
jgi:5-deoxy-5-amino-3-dehydroquinate synthase